MLYRALREVGAVTGGALNPLLPQQAKSDPQLHHSFPVHHHTPRWVACRNNHAHARSCEKADLASLKLSCDVEQLYTDATLVLDASTSIYACSSGRRKRRSELALAMRRRAGPRAYASKWERRLILVSAIALGHQAALHRCSARPRHSYAWCSSRSS